MCFTEQLIFIICGLAAQAELVTVVSPAIRRGKFSRVSDGFFQVLSDVAVTGYNL